MGKRVPFSLNAKEVKSLRIVHDALNDVLSFDDARGANTPQVEEALDMLGDKLRNSTTDDGAGVPMPSAEIRKHIAAWADFVRWMVERNVDHGNLHELTEGLPVIEAWLNAQDKGGTG